MMNLLAIFQALIAMGVCQPAMLHDANGGAVRAFVCPMDPILHPEEEGHDPAGAVGTPTQPGQKRA